MKKIILSMLLISLIILPIFAQEDEINEAKKEAENIRNKAIDFECGLYFPSEWEEAETLFAQAADEPSVSKYNSAAEAYNSIFELAIPLIAQAKEDEIMGIRTKLVNAGARVLFSEYFLPADDMALSAYSQYEAKDYYTAVVSAADALLMYKTMESAFDAWLLRDDVIEKKPDVLDNENFKLADETLNNAATAYLDGDYSLSAKKSEEAIKIYNSILAEAALAEADTAPTEADTAQLEGETALAEAETASGEEQIQTLDEKITLPATYRVRTWASYGDCFWNIAALPGVYGDPHKWRVLYNANKSKLQNPDNPDLIEPGMVLDIPSIQGEVRQGEWESGKDYPALN